MKPGRESRSSSKPLRTLLMKTLTLRCLHWSRFATRTGTARVAHGIPDTGGAELMAEISEEAIRAYWKEHREQLRQCETQRSTLTNLLIVITAALSALVVQQRFSLYVLPLCVFVAVAGLYGAVAVAKYYERASYHLSQARALTKDLVERGILSTDERLVQARAN